MTKELEQKLYNDAMNLEAVICYLQSKINNPYSSMFQNEELKHILAIAQGKEEEYEEQWMAEHKQRNMPPKR